MIQVPEVYPPSTQQQSSSMNCRRRRVPLTPRSIWPSLMVLVASSLLFLLVQAREVPMQKAIPPLMDPIPTLPEITHRVYFEIDVDGEHIGKLVFGLFGKSTPRTVENFRTLATCPEGAVGQKSGKPLCYKGTVFHRIIPDFFFQGGDFTHGTGVGGESIYGGTFEDENFNVNHNRPHMLTMSNCGERDCNGSQFLVTFSKTQWLNDKHVAFGVLVEGHALIEKIEAAGTYGGRPRKTVTIIECGEEPLKDEDKETHY